MSWTDVDSKGETIVVGSAASAEPLAVQCFFSTAAVLASTLLLLAPSAAMQREEETGNKPLLENGYREKVLHRLTSFIFPYR
jgi:hypothetical protein